MTNPASFETMPGTGHFEHGGAHRRSLRRDEIRERLMMLALAAPALLLVSLVVLIPIGMLVVLSLTDDNGALTAGNYLRLIDGDTYYRVFATTFEISAATTAICLALAIPLAYMLMRMRPRLASFAMVLILVPLWTSVLVRTYAWLAILQRNGLVNQAGMALHLWKEPLALSFNWTGTLIGTVHIMLPYVVLPIYGAMKKVDPVLMQASESLGATPLKGFWRVFFPLIFPGVAAGGLIVFVLCLGFYVVPEILGGGKVVMIAIQTAKDVQMFYNWGAAGALGVVLLVITLALIAIVNRLVPRRLARAEDY